jgi:hypothetical protein
MAVSSYEIVKRLNLPLYYVYMLMIVEFLLTIYLILHEFTLSYEMKSTI